MKLFALFIERLSWFHGMLLESKVLLSCAYWCRHACPPACMYIFCGNAMRTQQYWILFNIMFLSVFTSYLYGVRWYLMMITPLLSCWLPSRFGYFYIPKSVRNRRTLGWKIEAQARQPRHKYRTVSGERFKWCLLLWIRRITLTEHTLMAMLVLVLRPCEGQWQ